MTPISLVRDTLAARNMYLQSSKSNEKQARQAVAYPEGRDFHGKKTLLP